jgi:hypothetical protein
MYSAALLRVESLALVLSAELVRGTCPQQTVASLRVKRRGAHGGANPRAGCCVDQC